MNGSWSAAIGSLAVAQAAQEGSPRHQHDMQAERAMIFIRQAGMRTVCVQHLEQPINVAFAVLCPFAALVLDITYILLIFLWFEGLSADRLGQEINVAMKAVVYLLVSQFNLSMFTHVENGWADDGRFITAVLNCDDEPPVTQISPPFGSYGYPARFPTRLANT